MVAALASLLAVTGLTTSAARAAQPTTVALAGDVVSISIDGDSLATKVALASGKQICNSAIVWQKRTNHVTQIGSRKCIARDSTNDDFDSLTITGSRVVWADYEFGNNGYCVAMLTATLTAPKPIDLGICDGTEPDQYYDFAGSGNLLVTREYTQCEDNCAPDYSGTYQTSITLYQVTRKLTKIGPLKRNTHLWDVDAGRLLLGVGAKLEVVTPNHGSNARYIAGSRDFTHAFLSGPEAIGVAGTTVTVYDATSGRQILTRSLPPRSKVRDFSQGIVLYTQGQNVHLLRLADGRDRTVTSVKGLIDAKLDPSGLFYGYNIANGGKQAGRLGFVRFSALTQLLGP